MQKLTRWICLLNALLLSACAAIDLESEFAHDAKLQAQILDQSSDRYAGIDPLYLSPELVQRLEDFVGYTRDDRTRVERLQRFMYDEDQLGIAYSTDKTHTAMQLYEARSGNCLSAMNLYVALARHLGVEASFQRVQVQPSWDKRGGLLVLSEHINATGRLDQSIRYVADFTPEIALQQRTSKVLSDTEARAREYERAIERFNASNPYYHFAQGSVAFDDGDLEDARESFEKALELKREEPDFYLALRKVYLAQGKLVEARSLLREANELLALNAEIYRPSSSRLRLLERESVLNNSVESARRILITR